MRRRSMRYLSLTVAFSIIFTACSGSGGGNSAGIQKNDTTENTVTHETVPVSHTTETEPEPEPAEVVTVSSENLTADSNLGVKLELSPFLFDYMEDELDVSIQPTGTETADNGDWQANTYEINIGDMHDLDTWIDIRIPYDDKFCDSGEDPSQCVGAKYLNEDTGEWEDVLFDVDAEAGEVVIHTDHLSKYGCFEIKNAGLRNAYISKIDSKALLDSMNGNYVNESAEALAEFAAKGGVGERCFKLGQNAMKDVVAALNYAFSRVNDTSSVLQLKDLFFFTEEYAIKNPKLWNGIAAVGLGLSAASLGLEICKRDKTNEDILNIYKDAGMLLLSATAETALGISLVGVSMIDRSITEFGKAAQNYKVERINNLYLYYNDKFPGGLDYGTNHVARTTREWRDIVAKAVVDSEGNEKEFKKIIEDEIDSYARKFFKESDNVKWQLQTDFAEHFSGARVADITPDQEEDLVKNYKQRMYQRLSGAILKEMQNDYQRRIEKNLLDSMNDVKDELNRTITFNIHENMDDKDEPEYGGYQLRFAELSYGANSGKALKNWSGQLKKDGTAITETTVIGYIISGLPDHLNVYDPDANMDSDEPVTSATFSFNYPITEIIIGDEDDFAGIWYILDDSGERTGGAFKIDKTGSDSYTVTLTGDGIKGDPLPGVVTEKNNKEMTLDVPVNKGPVNILLADGNHMTISGINLLSGEKVEDTWDFNCVRG